MTYQRLRRRLRRPSGDPVYTAWALRVRVALRGSVWKGRLRGKLHIAGCPHAPPADQLVRVAQDVTAQHRLFYQLCGACCRVLRVRRAP